MRFKRKYPSPEAAFLKLRGVPEHLKWTFFAGLGIGLWTHVYMFTQKLPNHDDIRHMFSATYGTASGRWLLPTLLKLDGHFSLPWLIGTLSIVFIAIGACFVVEALGIRGKLAGAAVAAVMVTFPVVPATFTYMFTAGAYAIALALACAGAYYAVRGKLFSAILLMLSLAIYQGYLGFAAAVIACAWVLELLRGALSPESISSKEVLRGLGRTALGFLGGLALYFVSVKITTLWVPLTDYKGINEMGRLSLADIPGRIYEAYIQYRIFYIKDIYGAHAGPMKAIFAVLGISVAVQLARMLWGARKNRLSLALACVGLLLVPLAGNLIYLMASKAEVHLLMMYGMAAVLILPIALSERVDEEADPQRDENALLPLLPLLAQWGIVLSIAATCFNYAVFSNTVYLKMDIAQTQAQMYSERLLASVERVEGYQRDFPVYLIGFADGSVNPNPTPELDAVMGAGIMDMTEYLTAYSYNEFVRIYFGFSNTICFQYCEDVHRVAALPEVQQMPHYPEAGSIRVIEDRVVVKLSDMP